MTDLDPLPPSITELLEKEKRGYAIYETTKDAALGRILERVALTNLSGEASVGHGPARAIGVKAAALLAGGALVAGIVVGRVTAPSVPPSAPPPPTATTLAPAPIPSLTPPLPPEPAQTTARSATTTASVRAPSPGPGSLARERELVEAARSALARGRPNDALTAADRHAREYPSGQLAEEREALAVTALLSLDRAAEAETRRARFVRAFPNSMLLPPAPAGRDGGGP